MRTFATLALLVVIAATLSIRHTRGADDQPDEKEKAASVWMKQKLVASQSILAGLTEADFGKIEKSAESMMIVEYLEKWARADRPKYKELLGDFEHANKAMIAAAREKSLDGATLAYVQLTISCVNCHKVVRDTGK